MAGKRVLLRADLNVPVRDGRITDLTRIERLLPTIRELSDAGARVIVCSHFDRPKGKRVPEMSLRPMADAHWPKLGQVLGKPVAFAEDCVGKPAADAVGALRDGGVLVLENTRFHPGEEKNDPDFARQLAALADLYVNDAFSAAHRAHASTEGVAHHLPAYAGRLMQAELEALDQALGNPQRPVAAIVAGSKVSTKLELLGNLAGRVDLLVIGGAMANTFLAAQGHGVGKSLQEADMHDTARDILARAKQTGCEVMLPVDVVVAQEFKPNPPTRTVPVDAIPADQMALDVAPKRSRRCKPSCPACAPWSGTARWARSRRRPSTPPRWRWRTPWPTRPQAGTLRSVAGGGDTVSALRQAGVIDQFSYVSAAGGAFLEWMEGKTLAGSGGAERVARADAAMRGTTATVWRVRDHIILRSR